MDIEIVRAAQFDEVDKAKLEAELDEMSFSDLGVIAIRAGLELPNDADLTMATGIVGLNDPMMKAEAAGMLMDNILTSFIEEWRNPFPPGTEESWQYAFGRRSINGVTYVVGVDDAAVVLRVLSELNKFLLVND